MAPVFLKVLIEMLMRSLLISRYDGHVSFGLLDVGQKSLGCGWVMV